MGGAQARELVPFTTSLIIYKLVSLVNGTIVIECGGVLFISLEYGKHLQVHPLKSTIRPSERANFDRQYPTNGAFFVLQKSKYLCNRGNTENKFAKRSQGKYLL